MSLHGTKRTLRNVHYSSAFLCEADISRSPGNRLAARADQATSPVPRLVNGGNGLTAGFDLIA